LAAGERRELLRLLAAILHLGNVALEAASGASCGGSPSDEAPSLAGKAGKAANFSGQDMARIADGDAALATAARLLALDAAALEIALCARTVRRVKRYKAHEKIIALFGYEW